MLDARLGPEWKPNKAKFVALVEPSGNRIAIHTDPSFPRSWTREPYYSQIKSWSVASVAMQKQVVVYAGNRATVILPNKDVEVGTVHPDDQLIVGRTSAGDWTARLAPAKDVREETRKKWQA